MKSSLPGLSGLDWEGALQRLAPGLPLVRMLLAILEAAPEAVFAKDLAGRYLVINKAGADAIGLPIEMVLGRPDEELFPAGVAAAIRRWDQRVIDGGMPIRYEAFSPLGPRRQVFLTSKAPLLGPDGQTVGVVGIARDITEVRRLEEDLARLSHQSLDLLCVFDGAGRIHLVSDSFERVLGWRRDEVLGTRQRELVHPEDWQASAEVLRRLTRHGVPVIDFRNRVRCRDGSYRWLEWRCDPPAGDGVVYAVAREVTARTREEQELRAAKEEAEAVAARSARFLADMSHEIRTPLNAIIAAVELALDSPLAPAQRELLEVVSTASDALLALVNDVLDLSKIEADALDLEQTAFPPTEPLHQAASLVRGRAARQGVELAIEVSPQVPPLVVGDPHRLRQILVNLLDNAIKFSGGGVVSASLDATEGGLLYVVADEGRGIDADRLPTIFSPYRQADAKVAGRHGGTGLGLAISRRLAERMGGRLEAESGRPRGASFALTLPATAAVPAPAERSPPRLQAAGEIAGLEVLVAEDEPMNQLVMRRLLESLSCRARVVADGAAAVQSLVDQPPDVVLLDVQMPGVDGPEAARRIRALEGGDSRRTYLVALTASATREVREACAAAGMDEYLTKPVRREALAAVLERAAARRRQ